MRTLTAVVISLFCLPFSDNEKGNINYEFPDVIVKREFKSMDKVRDGTVSFTLATSGYYRECLQYQDVDSTRLKVKIGVNRPKIIDGKDFIIEKAKSYRMVMINEAHDRPQHRIFTKSMLKALYDQGFHVLMVEGLWNSANAMSKGYPVDTDGGYINEPVYASMIRYARKIGFDIETYYYYENKKIPYWDDTIKLDDRGSVKYINYRDKDSLVIKILPSGDELSYQTSRFEEEQAKNVYKIMQQHPGSKFLMHVGYCHLCEYAESEMARKLKKMLKGEDFLTIDQTMFDERRDIIDTISHTNMKRDHPFFVEDGINQSVNVTAGGHMDYFMFNGVLADSLGRPNYLFDDVEPRFVYNIPKSFTGPEDYIFAAYPLDEYNVEKEHTIAVDVVYAKKGAATPPLLLYKGKYALLRRGRDDVYKRMDIEVK
jgi:hypothetical protein